MLVGSIIINIIINDRGNGSFIMRSKNQLNTSPLFNSFNLINSSEK